jgi:hypothetical protein
MKSFDTRRLGPKRNGRPLGGPQFGQASCAIAILALCMAGCGTPRPYESREVVGPDSAQSPVGKLSSGALVVYTAPDGFDTLDPNHEHFTPYVIYSSTGQLLQKVRNSTGSFGSDPLTVSLAPGTYKVEGRAVNVGRVSLPVLVEQGKTTVVHLDGDLAGDSAEGLVKLPDGQAAGWKAQR